MGCPKRKYPPPISIGCMSHYLPIPYAYGRYFEAPGDTYFSNLREQSFQVPPAVWGTRRAPATVYPDAQIVNSIINMERHLHTPTLSISPFVVDKMGRQQVDNFYLACQLFRDQYKDNTGKLHPLDYFRESEIMWQCPPQMTPTYIKHPVCYPRYLPPPVLAKAVSHFEEWPSIPSQCLAGKYSRHSDHAYLR